MRSSSPTPTHRPATRVLAALGLATLPLGHLACVDDAAPGGGGPAFVPACQDTAPDAICTHLAAQGDTNVPVRGYNIEVPLAVKWTNASGENIPNGEIRWQLVSTPGQDLHGSKLLVSTSRTDGNGIATVTVRSGAGDVRFKVEATAAHAPKVTFDLSVFSKDAGEVKVSVKYTDGIYGPQARAFTRTQVIIFNQAANAGAGVLNTCQPGAQTFDPYDPVGTLPLPARLSDTLGALPAEKTFFGFNTGDAVTVLAFGQKEYADATIGLAWACWASDRNVAEDLVKPGTPLQVNLSLTDLTPRYAGTYTITSEYDILAVVPDNIESWIRDIGNLFRNPGQQLLAWLENIDEVEDFLSTIGPFRGALEGVLTDIIDSLLSLAPDVVGDIRNGVVDVFDILTSLDVISEVTFKEEPAVPTDASRAGVLEFPRCSLGEAGAPGAAEGQCKQEERWTKIGFNWRNSAICEGSNDQRCDGYRTYGFEDYGLDVVNAEFNAYTTNFWDLTIEPHAVQVDWGKLVLFVLEQLVLPMVFDPDVDSLEDLLYILVGGRECIAAGRDIAESCCNAFADSETIRNWGNVPQSAARSLCKQGIPILVTQLRGQLPGQDLDTGDAFRIGTSDAFEAGFVPEGVEPKACTLFDDSPVDLTVDKLGKQAGPRCSWIGYIDSDTVDPVEATFWGVRN